MDIAGSTSVGRGCCLRQCFQRLVRGAQFFGARGLELIGHPGQRRAALLLQGGNGAAGFLRRGKAAALQQGCALRIEQLEIEQAIALLQTQRGEALAALAGQLDPIGTEETRAVTEALEALAEATPTTSGS